MFRFPKTLDIVTLFHKASSPASIRVSTLLKQASAHASQTATEDQASDTTAQTSAPTAGRETFELEITEEPPTTDQLRTILDYVGTPAIPTVMKGASTTAEALRKFRESADNFQRPVVVDWNNGKAIAGENESEILKLLNSTKS
ncbi:duf1687 domain containing protein [Grosmannia clavigera kw1407]|uniref:Duf1687 domain containing protein n=1 Tax=Grosmannia clavigera (strain kw1407 / UAMH 11150) TaxID=655863 RepID=F0XT65_GROCL|nr:duf1687 domain containing protein [Grosmannia clavigera kw1407]EFW99334.1 duf1687 domain containing protein [Grosmannia clavigera kw1407]